MAKRKKGALHLGAGAMCNICGRNTGMGIASHVKNAHGVAYDDYKKCFYPPRVGKVVDAWDDSVLTPSGNVVVTHVLVRRFECPRGRQVRQSAR